MSVYKRILPYYAPYKGLVIAGLLFVVITNVFKVLGPWFLRNAVNGLEIGITTQGLWRDAGLILSVAVISGVFRYLMRKTVIGVSRHIEYDLRQDLFRHFLRLDSAFYDRSRIGDLLTRSTSDIEQVRMVLGPALMYTVNTFFSLAFSFVLMIMISPLLTLLVAVVVPISAGLVFVIGKKIHKASTETQEAYSDLSAVVQENLAGIRVVKAFRQEEAQKQLFEEQNQKYFKRSFRLGVLQGIFFPSMMIIFGVAIAGILLLGGYLIMARESFLIGDFVAFITYLMMLTWPMISIGWVVGLFQRGSASVKRLDALFDREPDIRDPEKPADIEKISGDLRFEEVGFTYPQAESKVLDGVSFHVAAGKRLGVVGRVGSGKSTILALMARLYDPQQGRILLDGVEIQRYRLSDLRDQFAYVPQDPLLFSTSLKENITLGEAGYTEADLTEALEISRLVQDVPDFPDGLATEIGERGITLSGGQKQRVAIARAVIRKPAVIVLDDALSAVDANTEELILTNLNRFMADRTAVIVSHRFSSIRDAEEIIVLEDGKIVERGVHDELIERGGVYTELFERQKMRDELEEQG